MDVSPGERVKAARCSKDTLRVDLLDIHWPDIDEDLSVGGLLRGLPAPRIAAEALLAAA